MTESTATTAASFIEPRALMRIKSLELRARVVVEGFLSGINRSPIHGFSVEFTEYRQYTPGDDLRYLDWKLFARSDRYYIKRFEDETNLRCLLLLDGSNSMDFGSVGYTKSEYARTLCGTLAYFLSQQRDAVGLVAFDSAIREYFPPRYRPGHLHRLMALLGQSHDGPGTDLEAPLRRVAELVQRRSLLVLISDLLAPVDQLSTQLGYLTSRGNEVVVFQVLDPAERELDFSEPSLFFDMESGRELYVDPDTVRDEYQRKFAAHNEAARMACDRLGVELHSLSTDQPLELALFDFLRSRMESGKRDKRTGNRGPGRGAR